MTPAPGLFMARLAMALFLLSLSACQLGPFPQEEDGEGGDVGESCGDNGYWVDGPCRAGLLCVDDRCQQPKAPVGRGERCDALTPCTQGLQCADRCVAFRKEGESCSHTLACESGLTCYWSNGCEASVICVREGSVGRVVTCDAGADASAD